MEELRNKVTWAGAVPLIRSSLVQKIPFLIEGSAHIHFKKPGMA